MSAPLGAYNGANSDRLNACDEGLADEAKRKTPPEDLVVWLRGRAGH